MTTAPREAEARKRAHELMVDGVPESWACDDVHSPGWEQRVCDRLTAALAAHADEAEALRAERDALQMKLVDAEARANARDSAISIARDIVAAHNKSASEHLVLKAERDEARATVVRLEGERDALATKLAAFKIRPPGKSIAEAVAALQARLDAAVGLLRDFHAWTAEGPLVLDADDRERLHAFLGPVPAGEPARERIEVRTFRVRDSRVHASAPGVHGKETWTVYYCPTADSQTSKLDHSPRTLDEAIATACRLADLFDSPAVTPPKGEAK